MLDKMRTQAQSAIVILLFGFIIFVFVFSFGAGSAGFRSGGCSGMPVAAMVNGEPITEDTFLFAFRTDLRNTLANRKERGLKREEKLAMRQRVIESLIEQTLLIQAAREVGLRVSDEERNADIRKSPMFLDDNKRFDFSKYKLIIQRYFETSPTVFEEMWRQQMLAQRMSGVIQEAARVTDEELEQSYRLHESKVDVEYVRLSSAMFRQDAQATDAEVAEFLGANRARVEAAYKERDAQYNKPKKVQVAHVFFETEQGASEDVVADRKERAELTHEDLVKGAEIAAQAKEYSQDDATREKGGELPLMGRDELTARWGAPLAEAAFALKEGELSGVVKSDKGFHVFKVLKVVEAEITPLEKVEQELARGLLLEERAGAKAKAEAERLFAEMKAGKTLEELLPKPAETADPAQPADAPKAPPAPKPQARKTGLVARMMGYLPQLGLDKALARAAFALTKEQPYPEQVFEVDNPLGGKEYVVFRLADRAEPDMGMFAQAKEDLRLEILRGRRAAQLRTWLSDRLAQARVETNESLLTDVDPQAIRQGRRPSAPMPVDDY
ncbi:MAG TPA: SurA N-terminal domain-containing protein [Myxococcota bacterium]|nr:SurA N-terminal domain-containing protein [Myxococcota bacterium]HRY95931.1 SurA N-terminal domain-containing protein [Myxococcota bacterium]